jgi:hypothetical protein
VTGPEKATLRFLVEQFRARAAEPAAVLLLADMLGQVAGLDTPPPRRARRSETLPAILTSAGD